MSKRDKVARAMKLEREAGGSWAEIFDVAAALLSDPDDRMVEAAAREIYAIRPDAAPMSGTVSWDNALPATIATCRRTAKAAIRAAMKAAGE